MTRPSKRKFNVKEQERDNNGRFAKKIQTVDNWGDDDDSGWDYDNGWDNYNDVNCSDNLLNERDQIMQKKTWTLPYRKNKKINLF